MPSGETILSRFGVETLLLPHVSDTGIPPDSATKAVDETSGHSAQAGRGGIELIDIQSLTRAIVRGDEAAFGEFYERFSGRLYGLLLFLTSGREESSREILQLTMIKVARKFRVFEHETDCGRGCQRLRAMHWSITSANSRVRRSLFRLNSWAWPSMRLRRPKRSCWNGSNAA